MKKIALRERTIVITEKRRDGRNNSKREKVTIRKENSRNEGRHTSGIVKGG